MNNNNALEEFFVWEEKSLIDQNQNLLKNVEQDNSVTTIETKTDSMPKDWRDITDPKLRRKIYQKAYRESHREYFRKKSRTRYNEKRPELLLEKSNYRKLNKDKCNLATSLWKQKNKNNPDYLIPKRLRNRLRQAIKGNYKEGSAVKDLGCSVSDFKSYIESKFQLGMTWDNWGVDGWHIDHIRPLASFDLTDRNQLLEACHYTNLQPLWANENLSKGSNIT
jgi:hypothetical protein